MTTPTPPPTGAYRVVSLYDMESIRIFGPYFTLNAAERQKKLLEGLHLDTMVSWVEKTSDNWTPVEDSTAHDQSKPD